MAKVSLKLVVDQEKNRVVFAESEKDFVDILFSFLTLPMGTIIRLLGKKSGVGCMDKLYESVENLDAKYLQTAACRTMLLQPRGASETQCEDLVINVDDLMPRRIYRCPSFDCFTKKHCLFSNIQGAKCPCGEVMDKYFRWNKIETYGVFIEGEGRFMISDDLNVTPISTEAALSLLQRLGVKNVDSLEYRTVDVSKDEILNLLKSILLSETPLTDCLLRKPEYPINHESKAEEFKFIDASRVKSESSERKESKMICLKLLENKFSKEVVYAEATEEFVDILFSFLTFPLGSIVNILNKCSLLGCADNLYRSVEALSIIGNKDLIKSECVQILLAPKLGTQFGCSNKMLRIDEKMSTTTCTNQLGCEICFNAGKNSCSHGIKNVTITKINPKLPVPGTEHGGGFVNGYVKFMVTNEMVIAPLSPAIGLKAIKGCKAPIASLVERDIDCGEAEVLNLLKACLVSRTVLDMVFSPKSWRRTPLA